jgi:hypothetical protein
MRDQKRQRNSRSGGGCRTTLLEIVFQMSDPQRDDRAVAEAVRALIRTGAVRLTGNFRHAPLDAF